MDFHSDESLVIESHLQLEDGRKQHVKLLALPQMPDGFFLLPALTARWELCRCAKKKGIKVPQDVR
jgi:DNA-binding LacI/PurR family transcriptional regulator